MALWQKFKKMFECSLMSTLYLKKYGYIILCVKVSKCGVFSGPYFPHSDWYGNLIRSISPYSVRMRENTDQEKLRIWTLFTQWIITIHSVQMWENTDQKKLRIWTLFTQCFVINDQNSSGLFYSNLESLRLQFY